MSIAGPRSVSGPLPRKGLQRRLRLPALEDVDTAAVYQVRADAHELELSVATVQSYWHRLYKENGFPHARGRHGSLNQAVNALGIPFTKRCERLVGHRGQPLKNVEKPRLALVVDR